LIEIGSKTAEKNSTQTNKQSNKQTDKPTDITKIMVTWPWTNNDQLSLTNTLDELHHGERAADKKRERWVWQTCAPT